MADLSKVSCDAYRQLVRKEPRFVPYFRQATPELELGTLNIGSRPAKRNPKGGIESLRAIPWTFAWTQTRVHLSAWLGCGEALNPDDEEKVSENEMGIYIYIYDGKLKNTIRIPHSNPNTLFNPPPPTPYSPHSKRNSRTCTTRGPGSAKPST